MFIDYLPLLLINMTAAFVILAAYLFKGIGEKDQSKWVIAFAVPGVIAVVNGTYMIWTWPLPQIFNIAYGEMTVLLGIIFAGTSVCIAKKWNLQPLTIYSALAGLAAVVIGIQIFILGITPKPLLTGLGFILSGGAGVFSPLVIAFPQNKLFRYGGILVLLAAAAIWAITGYIGYWMHMESFMKWIPATMK